MLKRFIATVAVAALTACASAGTRVDPSQVGQFQKGVSTPGDVIAALGAPQQTAHLDNGSTTLVYVYVAASPKAATFIPIVGAFAGGADAHSTMVTFRFGPDGRLAAVDSSEGDSSARLGF